MRLSRLSVGNFRSIKAAADIRLEPLQAFVGENNCGKSNLLRAVKCFLSAGAGGVEPSDFNDQGSDAFIECEFSDLDADERRKLRPYMLRDRVILQKIFNITSDAARGKVTVKAEYQAIRPSRVTCAFLLKRLRRRAQSQTTGQWLRRSTSLNMRLPRTVKSIKRAIALVFSAIWLRMI